MFVKIMKITGHKDPNMLLHYTDLRSEDFSDISEFQAEVVKLNQLTPLDGTEVIRSVQKTGALLVAEEAAAHGCVGQRLAALLEQAEAPAKVTLVNCGEGFVTHGKTELLKKELSLDGEGIAKKAWEVLGRG